MSVWTLSSNRLSTPPVLTATTILPHPPRTMALRSRARILLDSAAKADGPIFEGGLRGFMGRFRERFTTGKLLRPDVEDDILRKPVSEAAFRYPSPGYVPIHLSSPSIALSFFYPPATRAF